MKSVLFTWGCFHRCGKRVLGEEVRQSFREYSSAHDDIVLLFAVLPDGRHISASKAPDEQKGFEFAVRMAQEEGGSGPLYWKLITHYHDRSILKKIWPDGRAEIQRLVAG